MVMYIKSLVRIRYGWKNFFIKIRQPFIYCWIALRERPMKISHMDMFGESIEGHKYRTPYQVVKMINPNSKEDMELLREVLKNNHFDDEDE